MSLLFDFATKNLHLATIFYHLVAKWRLNNFFNFEPCKANFLKFNFHWKDLVKFLQEFTCSSDVDIKLFAGILQATGHSHSSRSKMKEEFQALTDLIPNTLMANNGYV